MTALTAPCPSCGALLLGHTAAAVADPSQPESCPKAGLVKVPEHLRLVLRLLKIVPSSPEVDGAGPASVSATSGAVPRTARSAQTMDRDSAP